MSRIQCCVVAKVSDSEFWSGMMDTIAIQIAPKKGMSCEMSLPKRNLIRHIYSVIPNSGIA